MSERRESGAESLVRTAREAGVDVCFANPGTTEMQLVAALDGNPGMRAVLGLHEGVCAGAADGYARMTGRPALTLLHLGPGLANALSNLHNARRARSPVVNVVGDHASWHGPADSPLTSDIAALARTVGSVHTVGAAKDLACDTAAAIEAALAPPGRVATLIVPQDCAWDPVARESAFVRRLPPHAVDPDAVSEAARALRGGGAALFLGGAALREAPLRAAARIRDASGCRVLHETVFARLERGGDVPRMERLPYFPEQAAAALAGLRAVVLAAPEPVSFFGYPGVPSRLLPPRGRVVTLARPEDDVEAGLEALADALAARGAPRPAAPAPPRARPAPPTGALTPETLGQALAALQPEGAIVVDESATSGLAYFELAALAPAHTVLALTGGAIGQGLPCAAGAAVARPDRKVIALLGDGGAMYTPQALWTLAREDLDVAVVICANRRYRILELELARAGVREPGKNARALTELHQPPLRWVQMARAMGVPGVRVDDADELVEALGRAFSARGPCLVEAVL